MAGTQNPSANALHSWLDKVADFLMDQGGIAPLAHVGSAVARTHDMPRTAMATLIKDDNRFNLSQDKRYVSLVSGAGVPKFQLVNNESDAEVAVRVLQGCSVIAIDLEGDLDGRGKASLIQVEGDGKVYIFDVLSCPTIVANYLKAILESESNVKVIHDCRRDSEALYGQFNVTLKTVFDTQCAAAVLAGKNPKTHHPGLNQVLSTYASVTNPLKGEIMHSLRLWNSRPLETKSLVYAAQDVVHLRQAYEKLRVMLEINGKISEAVNASLENVEMGLGMARSKSLRSEGYQPRVVEPDPAVFENMPVAKKTVYETAELFVEHLRKTNPGDTISRCEFDEALFKWKARNASLNLRGGPSAMIFCLTRSKKIRYFPSQATVYLRSGKRSNRDARALAAEVVQQRERVEANKEGVIVSLLVLDKKPDGSSRSVARGILESRPVVIQNIGALPVLWKGVTILSNRDNCFSFECSVAQPSYIQPQQSVHAALVSHPSNIGVYRSILSFEFSGFTIGRFLTLRCGNSDIEDLLKPSAPYHRPRQRFARPLDSNIIDGERPEGGGDPFQIPLPNWPRVTPLKFRNEVKNHVVEQRLTQISQGFLPTNYKSMFEDLMRLEAMQMDEDVQVFNMKDALLRPSVDRACLELTVPGLSENRPSVLRGDSVLATVSNGCFRGYAHHINLDSVSLRFNRVFHDRLKVNLGGVAHGSGGTKADISFEVSKSNFRGMLQGLLLSESLDEQVLFPSLGLPLNPPRKSVPVLAPFNRSLNAEQLQAVRAILEGQTRPAPYLLFGPPGTGKTMTLIELIKQIRHHFPASRILACAPSNTAADIFVERLSDIPPSEMMRYNAWSRSFSEVSTQVRNYTTLAGESYPVGGFPPPSLSTLLQKHVVVATCNTAAKLHNLGVPRGHFEFIIIDEAGHAWEPEAVAAVCCLLDTLRRPTPFQAKTTVACDNQLVLAGDPQQLGPIVRSHLAREFGLARSVLERIIDRPPYQRNPHSHAYDHLFLTKLLCNYRSHPSILSLPNRFFYDGELKPCADPATSHPLADWQGLPRAGFPIVFHGVEGQEDREANSPSWFNVSEIQVVLDYVQALVRQTGRHRVPPSKIGIIAPYAKQCDKMSKALKMIDLGGPDGVSVGSVEKFQGQERRVIIISTVRSDPRFIETDVKHNLGFVSNPKRFNVAITRAQALLIVVGNPKLLAEDEHWGQLLWYSVDNGAYTGSPLPPRPAEEGEGAGRPGEGGAQGEEVDVRALEALMSNVSVAEAGEEWDEEGVGLQELAEGPVWRRED